MAHNKERWIDVAALEFEKQYRADMEVFWWDNFTFDTIEA